MRVMLIVPTSHYKTSYPSWLSLSDFPTGFGYLASSLKQAGHQVIGVNPNNIPGYPSAKLMMSDVITNAINTSQPDLIGLGGLCTDYAFLRDAIGVIRNVAPKTPIVLGGQIVTNDAEFIFNDLKPDVAITGEAEHAICVLADEPARYKNVMPGVEQRILDNLPFPDYEPFGVQDMLDNHSEDTRLLYRYSRPYPRPWVVVASRSCPFSCTFCIHGKRSIPYRARSIPNIMAEIKETYEKYKYNILLIDDELFAVNKQRMLDFCDGVLNGKKEYGWSFDWMFQTHASSKLDLDTLKLARSSGCFLFSYGLESASPTVLKSMNKKIEVQQVIEAIELAQQADIGFSANLIFGDIAETQDTVAESLAFWLAHGRKDFVFLTNLMPYPGSKLFDDVRSYGAFSDKHAYYEHIDEGVINMTTIPPETFQNICKLLVNLETSWLFVTLAKNVRAEVEGTLNNGDKMYKVWATCPHCGKESLYRQAMNDTMAKHFSIGTGCTHCNRKIKITA